MTLVKFYCPTHGYLCAASVHAVVRCGEPTRSVKGIKRRCNRVATTVNPNPKRRAA